MSCKKYHIRINIFTAAGAKKCHTADRGRSRCGRGILDTPLLGTPKFHKEGKTLCVCIQMHLVLVLNSCLEPPFQKSCIQRPCRQKEHTGPTLSYLHSHHWDDSILLELLLGSMYTSGTKGVVMVQDCMS